MAEGKFVAYYRVSTERQGRSGLGLAAQRKAVEDYLNGGRWSLVAEFTEVESGKRDKNRPQLVAALDACRKHKATLVIAKLDRLSRNAGFLMTLRDGNVEVRACDMPEASTLEFGIRAVVAQHEREEISRRTKVALAAAKVQERQGPRVRDGRTLKPIGWNGRRLAQQHKAAATDYARGIAAAVQQLRRTNPTVRSLTAAMNEAGIKTATGGRWHTTTVQRLLQRLR